MNRVAERGRIGVLTAIQGQALSLFPKRSRSIRHELETDSLLMLILILALMTVLLGLFSLAILVGLIRMLFKGGYMLGGKEVVYVPLCPILTWLFARWTREAWKTFKVLYEGAQS
jgi:hypothetical protein